MRITSALTLILLTTSPAWGETASQFSLEDTKLSEVGSGAVQVYRAGTSRSLSKSAQTGFPMIYSGDDPALLGGPPKRASKTLNEGRVYHYAPTPLKKTELDGRQDRR